MARHFIRLGGVYLACELAWMLAAAGAYALGFGLPGT